MASTHKPITTVITTQPGSYDPITGNRLYTIRQQIGTHPITLDIDAPNGRAAMVAFRMAFGQVGKQDCLRGAL